MYRIVGQLWVCHSSCHHLQQLDAASNFNVGVLKIFYFEASVLLLVCRDVFWSWSAARACRLLLGLMLCLCCVFLFGFVFLWLSQVHRWWTSRNTCVTMMSGGVDYRCTAHTAGGKDLLSFLRGADVTLKPEHRHPPDSWWCVSENSRQERSIYG